MDCKFVVGQKVVCVDDGIEHSPRVDGVIYTSNLDGLTRGEVYTVSAVDYDQLHHAPVVRLAEILRKGAGSSPTIMGHLTHFYGAYRFRPAYDLSIFHEILASVDDPVELDPIKIVEAFFDTTVEKFKKEQGWY